MKDVPKSINKWISSVFQNDDDGAMLQDVLRYCFEINANPSENRPFILRDLQLWIVENNWKIKQEYQDSKGHTSPSNKVHAKESRINRIFFATIGLGLIEKRNKTSPYMSTSEKSMGKSMYIDAKVQYVYTGFGILLAHLIRSMNLENAILEEKDRRKIETKKIELTQVNVAIYKLLDSTFSTGEEYPSVNIFYKSFYKKVNDEGHFNKIINYIVEVCEYTEAENMKELLQYHIHDFALKNKSDRKTILQLWSKTLEEQSLEDRDLIIYGEKLLTELRFEFKMGPSREYERQRFKHRADHEKIVLEGKCEMCIKKNIVIWPYIEYKRRIADLEVDDLIRFDCQKCKKENSCVIPNF